MSGKSQLLVLRYRHFYTAKNKVNYKTLTYIIKFIFILKNGNSGMFVSFKASFARNRIISKLIFIEMHLSTHFVVLGHN